MTARRPPVLLLGDTLSLGGTEGQFVEVARGLDRSRWEPHIGCVRAEGPLRARLDAVGLRPWSVGPSSFKSPGLVISILRLAGYLRRHAVPLIHCFDFYSNLVGVPAGRVARTPVVIASQRDMGDLRSRNRQSVHSRVLGLATHVLVNTEAIGAQLRYTRAARHNRLGVIPNGVDVDRFSPAIAPPQWTGPVTVATVANLRPEKGLGELLDAAAIVSRNAPQVRFKVWGDGPLRNELEARVWALGLTGNVELRGATREPESALRQSHIFVLPSLSEACSNVVLEAMATGLPVVATRVGGLPGLIEEHRTGLLVPPRDAPALARAILQLVEAPAVACEIGVRGRARAVADFGLDRLRERIDRFYREAVGNGQSAGIAGEAMQRS